MFHKNLGKKLTYFKIIKLIQVKNLLLNNLKAGFQQVTLFITKKKQNKKKKKNKNKTHVILCLISGYFYHDERRKSSRKHAHIILTPSNPTFI